MPRIGPYISVFEQTVNVTVANTVAQTSLVGPGNGSPTLPADFLQFGSAMQLWAFGAYSTAIGAPPTLRIRVKFGGSTLLDTTATAIVANRSGLTWTLHAVFVCRVAGAPGTVIANGEMRYSQGHGQPDLADYFTPNTVPTPVSTLAPLLLDVTAQWGTANAANSITVANLSLSATLPV